MAVKEEITYKRNKQKQQFEFDLEDGKTGVVAYEQPADSKIRLTRTEVPKDIRGKGYGKEMVKQTLIAIDNNGLKVDPECPFVEYYMDKNPKWNRLRY